MGTVLFVSALFVSVFLVLVWSNYLFVTMSVCANVMVPDGSVKKNFSGESRNRDRSQRASSDPQLKELCGSHTLEQTVEAHHTRRKQTHTQTVNLGMSHSVISCKLY